MKKVLGIGVISALAVLMVVSLATAQPGGGAGGPGGGGGFGGGRGMGGGRGGITQETLGATAEEWKVLEAKVTKVQTLSQQLQGGGRGMGGRGRGMGGDMGGAPAAAPETELSKARASLQALVGPEATGNPTPDQIKAALTAYRQARDKAKTELASAQADLKKVVNAKQEAILVVRGLLD